MDAVANCGDDERQVSEGRCDDERTPLECTSVDCTKAHREPSPRPAGTTLGLASRAGSDAATNSGKPAGAAQGRSPLRPEDESSAKQPPVDDPTPPDPGGAQASPAGIPLPSTPVATSSSAFDTSGENATVDTLRIKSLALKAAERDGLRMAASSLSSFWKLGVARVGCTHAFNREGRGVNGNRDDKCQTTPTQGSPC